MDRVGIEFISVFRMPPVDFIHLAADLGVRHIGLGLEPIVPANPYKFPDWSLRTDAGQRRATKAALRERGVSVSVAEGFMIFPGTDIRDRKGDFDLMRELDVMRFNMLSLDPDVGRTHDQYAQMVDMVEQVGAESVLEFAPIFPPTPDLKAAVAAVRYVGRPTFRILVDTMHLFRSGGTPEDLKAVDPALLGYVQLCDVPREPKMPYGDEASNERMIPGEGDAPLRDYLDALPRNIVVGLEVPMLSRAQSGASVRELMSANVDAARKLVASLKG